MIAAAIIFLTAAAMYGTVRLFSDGALGRWDDDHDITT